MTKTDHIRTLLAQGRPPREIARIVGTSLNRVEVVRWGIKNPSYWAQWIAAKRRKDPEYYARELVQQRRRAREKGAASRTA